MKEARIQVNFRMTKRLKEKLKQQARRNENFNARSD